MTQTFICLLFSTAILHLICYNGMEVVAFIEGRAYARCAETHFCTQSKNAPLQVFMSEELHFSLFISLCLFPL